MADRKVTLQGGQPVRPHISIREHQGAYLIHMPKNLQVIDLWKKAIPAGSRKFDPNLNNGWLIAPDFIEHACKAIEKVYGGHIKRPDPIKLSVPVETRTEIFRVEYVGSTHERPTRPFDRPDLQWSAYGAIAPKQWVIEFPERELKRFFGAIVDLNKQSHPTFYQVLLVPEDCDFQTLKSAHRRLVRQWHPDLCAEPDATERFRAIQEAYEVLCDPIGRRKYDAGLYFERQEQGGDLAPHLNPFKDQCGYRAPLTSGLITVKGIQTSIMTRFLVSEILSWEDLRNNKDQVAISSWRAGQETYQIIWR